VYKDYPSFHPRVCEAIKDLIPEQVASKLSVGIVQHSRIVGVAIVAMMAEKMDQQDSTTTNNNNNNTTSMMMDTTD
jgi:hexokinase